MGKSLLHCNFTDSWSGAATNAQSPQIGFNAENNLAENNAVIQRRSHNQMHAYSKTGGYVGENEKLTHLFCMMKQKKNR